MSFYPYSQASLITGEFTEVDHGLVHTFTTSTEVMSDWDFQQGATHRMFTRDGSRPIKLLKTVCYVGVDEDQYGNCVWEKWHIKNLKLFS